MAFGLGGSLVGVMLVQLSLNPVDNSDARSFSGYIAQSVCGGGGNGGAAITVAGAGAGRVLG